MRKTNYDEHYFTNHLYRSYTDSPRDHMRAQLVKQHKPSGRLLDIGCAEGHLLYLLSKTFHVQGFEISSYACQQANELLPGNPVRCQDFTQSSLPANHFDAIVAFNILEHLSHPSSAIRQLANSLKPGGVLVGSVPNNQPGAGYFATHLTNFIDKTHVNTLPVTRWRRLFRRHGLTPVHEFGEIPMLRNHALYLKNRLWPQTSFNYIFTLEKKVA